jgi:hypothetical protein
MNKKRFFINLLIYVSILMGYVILYGQAGNEKDNTPKSTVEFIYAKF